MYEVVVFTQTQIFQETYIIVCKVQFTIALSQFPYTNFMSSLLRNRFLQHKERKFPRTNKRAGRAVCKQVSRIKIKHGVNKTKNIFNKALRLEDELTNRHTHNLILIIIITDLLSEPTCKRSNGERT